MLACDHALVVGEVEEQQHEDARLGVQPHQRDHADPDRDRDVVAEDIENQIAPIKEKGTASMTIAVLTADFVFMYSRMKIEEQRDGQHDLQPLLRLAACSRTGRST